MEKTKVTKKDVLAVVAKLAEGMDPVAVGDVTVTAEDVIAYAEKTIAQIDAKNEKARERAAEKKAEGDALRQAVLDVLSAEPKTIAEIVEAVDAEDMTSAKVVARLTSLVKADLVVKSEVKGEDGRKLKAYALA